MGLLSRWRRPPPPRSARQAPLEKTRGQTLAQAHDRLDTRAQALARALRPLLEAIAQDALREAERQGLDTFAKVLAPGTVIAELLELDGAAPYSATIAKVQAWQRVFGKAERPLSGRLAELVTRFGVAQAVDGAEGAIRQVLPAATTARPSILGERQNRRREHVPGLPEDEDVILPPGVFDDERTLPDLANTFYRRAESVEIETRQEVYRLIRQTIEEAQRETPLPSSSTIARRIRDRMSGLSAHSWERAFTIARTELGIAENTGIVEGYKATGVEALEWIAVTTDRRSGARKHWEMDGVIVPIGESFRLPSGVRVRYPLDPLGPVGEVINCRCSVAPVRR
jgi:hypothetical protein